MWITAEQFIEVANEFRPKVPIPPPPPPPKGKKGVTPAPVSEKKAKSRFEVEVKDGHTVYFDTILKECFKISNNEKAKKTIDQLIRDLENGVEQFMENWSTRKGAFLRGDAQKFNKEEILHELAWSEHNNALTKQKTGRWRIYWDDEIKKPSGERQRFASMKTHEAKK